MTWPLLFLSGCAWFSTSQPTPVSATMPTLPEITRVEFRFHDASVPPPDHRSYTIQVTATEVSRVTDSYGEIVADDRRAGSEADLQAAVAAFRNAGFTLGEDRETDGCSGGTGRSVNAFSGETEVFTGYAGECAGGVTGPLRGDLDSFQHKMMEITGFTCL